MESRQKKLSVSSGQQWACLLVFFLFFKGCTANDMVVTSPNMHALPGHNVSLHCAPKNNATVTQVQWSRCNNSHLILVFSPVHGIHFFDSMYKDRVSMNKYHTFNLKQLQEGDFGAYCCHLSTYPSGSLNGHMLLLKGDEKDDRKGRSMEKPENKHQGLSTMLMVYIACGIVTIVLLNGIIIMVVCKKRRRKLKNPKYIMKRSDNETTCQPSMQGKGPGSSPDTGMKRTTGKQEVFDDDHDEMYLNVSKPSSDNS